MNRREVLNGAIAFAVAGQAIAQTSEPKVKISELEKLKAVWDDAEFNYENIACVLVRVPAPEKPSSPRVFEANKNFYSAYSRICPHMGCRAQLPNGLHQLECGCHGSIFSAADGSVKVGPATQALRGVKLELVEASLFAVGWLES